MRWILGGICALLFLSSADAFASCVGVQGEAAKRCQCHEVEIGLPAEAFACAKDEDCTVVEGLCADWAVLSSKYIKEQKLVLKNRLPSLKTPPKPQVACRDRTCTPKRG